MLTAAKLVLPALAAALFVWGAAWCVVRTLRPQMADTAAVGGEPPRSSKAMAALAGLLFVCVLQLVFCHAAQANNPGVGLPRPWSGSFTATPTRGITSTWRSTATAPAARLRSRN